MEQVLANKTDYFINNFGYEIHIITEDQKEEVIGYNFNNKIKFHDMAVSTLNDKTIKGFTFLKNIFELRTLYTSSFNEIKPDVIVVCERGYLDYVIPFIHYPAPKIREYHFAKEAVKIHASLMKPMIKRIKHLLTYKVIFKMFNKYDYLVLLTNTDKQNGGYKTNLEVIPNMLAFGLPAHTSTLAKERVISVGSMHDKRKGFDIQIKLWKDVVKKHPNWILDIYGDGIERKNLQALINILGLNKNVILHGISNKMDFCYLESSIFLFTSLAEGLPMVLIEAQSFGLPIVSFDCPTGPSDIVKNNIDGFIVAQDDIYKLKEKLLNLIENKEIRQKMGKAASENAIQFTPKVVSEQWKNLFDKLIQKNEN
jgi:glycosyltransferase involved in cell wall biosynthesis